MFLYLIDSINKDVFDHPSSIRFKRIVFTLEKFLAILRDGESVINLSSVNACTGTSGTAVYAASKAALNSFTRTEVTELAPEKLRVNAVNPGSVNTPISGDSATL